MPIFGKLRQGIPASMLKNASFLYIVHFGNYLYPLFVTPILATSLGVENYGKFVYVLSIAQIGMLIADYGFGYSGVQRTAENKANVQRLSETYFSIIYCKLIFLAMLIGVIVAGYLIVGRELANLIWFIPFVIGSSLTPHWFFTGTERSEILAALTVIPKLIAIPIFIAVFRDHATFEQAALFFGLPALLSAVGLNLLIFGTGQVVLLPPDPKSMATRLREGWYVFLSQASTTLYTTINPILMFHLLDPKAVGYFVVADKLRLAFQSLISPLLQSANARISAIGSRDPVASMKLTRKSVFMIFTLSCLSALFLVLFASPIVSWLFGPTYAPSAKIIPLLSLAIPIVGIGSSVGLLAVIPNGGGKFFSRTVMIAGAVNLAVLLLAIPFLGMYSAAFSIVTAEFIIAVAFLLYVKSNMVKTCRQ